MTGPPENLSLVGQAFLPVTARRTRRAVSDAGVPSSEADKNVCPTEIPHRKNAAEWIIWVVCWPVVNVMRWFL
jgi:hypothetical protein